MQFYNPEMLQSFSSVKFKYIRVRRSGSVFHLTLARAEKRNALNVSMVNEIAFAMAYANDADPIRCIVIDAEGPVFCAGMDLKGFADGSVGDGDFPAPLQPVLLGEVFSALYKPCIARVEGNVMAGGFLIIAGCHLVLSVSGATYSLPEVRRGIWPMQVMAALRSIIPVRKLIEMCITGGVYTASEAHEMGLVTRIVSDAGMDEEAHRLAAAISANAPLAIRKGLEVLGQLNRIPADVQHSFLKTQLDMLLETEDAKEGILAFMEKREPVWKGR